MIQDIYAAVHAGSGRRFQCNAMAGGDPASQGGQASTVRVEEQVDELLEAAAQHYRKALQASTRARQYLAGRGIGDVAIAHYGLGYARPVWRDLREVLRGFDAGAIEASGLLVNRHGDAQGPRFDRFRGRIMFPIRSLDGRIRGFGGRAVGDEFARAKYFNSPESEGFRKRELVYGLHEAQDAIRAEGHAVVMEGYIDVIGTAQAGFDAMVGTLGTACTSAQVQSILDLAPSITFCFDGDEAGQRATLRALWTVLPMAINGRSFRFARLPAGHDPHSMVRGEGAAAFAACVERADPLGKALNDAVGQGCELQWAEGRARFAARAAQAWRRLPAGQEREALLERTAYATKMSASELLDYFGGRA